MRSLPRVFWLGAGATLLVARCSCPTTGLLPDGGLAVVVTHNPGDLTLTGDVQGSHAIDAIAGTRSGHFVVGISNTDSPAGLFAFYADLGAGDAGMGTFTAKNAQANGAVSTGGVSWTQATGAGQDFSLQLTDVDTASVAEGTTSGKIHGTLDVTLTALQDAGSTVTAHSEF